LRDLVAAAFRQVNVLHVFSDIAINRARTKSEQPMSTNSPALQRRLRRWQVCLATTLLLSGILFLVLGLATVLDTGLSALISCLIGLFAGLLAARYYTAAGVIGTIIEAIVTIIVAALAAVMSIFG